MMAMGSASFSISPLEQFLTTETIEENSNNADVSSIDLKDICALRQRSIRKFARALDDIATRYDGDGDEEADDVIDLENLQVIEDRGYILNRFNQSVPSSSSCHSPKGKGRAVDTLRILEMLDPVALDGDDEWAQDEQGGDDEDANSSDDDSGSDEDESSHHSDSSSLSSSFKIPEEDKTIPSTSSSSILSDPSPIESRPQRPASCFDDHTITNELFERLKKRIQERSSDINKHQLYKQSIHCLPTGRKDFIGFSSPSSSLIASSSISSALTPTEYMISPYLQRLLHPTSSSTHAMNPVMKSSNFQFTSTPQTPATVRTSQTQGSDSSSCISYLHQTDTTIGKTRRCTKRSLDMSHLSETPSHQPNMNQRISPSSSARTERYSIRQQLKEDRSKCKLSTTKDEFKPVFLFKSPLSKPFTNSTSSDNQQQQENKTRSHHHHHQSKKIKSHHIVSEKNDDDDDFVDSIQTSEIVQSSRESSEDPMYLPPPKSFKKT